LGGVAVSGVELPLFVAAALLLLAAHALRALRWSLLFPRGRSEPDRRGLLLSLGIGYAVNAILPFRIGEIVRGAVASGLRRTRFAEVMATVVVERLSDIALVTVLVAGIALGSGDTALPKIVFAYAGSFAALAGVAVLLRHSAVLRRAVWKAAGLFNPKIRLALADFGWSTAEVLVGGTLLRWQFTIATFAMWSMYFAAYAAFGAAIHVPTTAVIDALLFRPFSSFLVGAPSAGISPAVLQIFVLAPVVIILAGLVRTRRAPEAKTAPIVRIHSPDPHFAARTRYHSLAGYDDFLDALFSNTRSAVSGFGMQAVEDCVVHGFYQGGSEALTALVETRDEMLIRKFALGTAAVKLKEQADWLKRHGDGQVPLVPVLNPRSSAGAFSYDMPLWQRTSPFFEAIHSMPLVDSSRTMLGLLERIDVLHSNEGSEAAHSSRVDEYLARKATANARQIVDFTRSQLGGDEYRINGVGFSLDEWRVFDDRNWLSRQVSSRRQAVIHGDLTIENVVIAPDHESGFYVIDPNPENIFDSPMIDWAKMMQSLHLGYETLNRSVQATPSDGEIALPIARSEAYASLHRLLESEIVSRFSEDALREVYFHELVNYLRLTPYKIRQSAQRGLAFFACTSLLLREYQQNYA
jgi:hypothetical protein